MTVVQAGGMAGLVTTTTADTTILSPADAHALREHVTRAGLLGPPPVAGPRSEPQPDRFDQEITVEHGGQLARLRVADQDSSTEVRDLVRFIRLVPGASHQLGPPA